MVSSSRASARSDQVYRSGPGPRPGSGHGHGPGQGRESGRESGRNRADELDEFAEWIEGVMRERGYDIDSPRGGGKSKLADDAGVHRAAVSRLIQRQSMPDLETMRRLATVLGVPLRDMLIRSGRLSENDLPIAGARGGDTDAPRLLSPEEAARKMGIPPELQAVFVRVTKAFLPQVE